MVSSRTAAGNARSNTYSGLALGAAYVVVQFERFANRYPCSTFRGTLEHPTFAITTLAHTDLAPTAIVSQIGGSGKGTLPVFLKYRRSYHPLPAPVYADLILRSRSRTPWTGLTCWMRDCGVFVGKPTFCGTLGRDPKNHGNVVCFQSLGGNGLQKSPTSYNILEYPSNRDWNGGQTWKS